VPLRCLAGPAVSPRAVTAALLLVCTATVATPARAQVPDSIKKKAAQDTLNAIKDTIKQEARHEVVATAHVIRWYEVAAAAGGVAALTALDEPISALPRSIARRRVTTSPRCSVRKASRSITRRSVWASSPSVWWPATPTCQRAAAGWWRRSGRRGSSWAGPRC
jgi:hypothetical protein